MGFNIDKYALTLKLILFFIPILFLLGLFVPYIFGYETYSIYSLYITIPLILAVVIYYLVRNKKDIVYNINVKYINLLNMIYVFIYIETIIILLYFEIRITLYFISMSCLFIVILAKILFFDNLEDSKNLILLQIILFFLNLSYSVTLKYPFFFGRTDPLFHSWFIASIINNGYISEYITSFYTKFPLWHIFVSGVAIITKIDLEPHKIMYLLNGIINSSIIIISYYISKMLFKKEKIAYLTSLFLCIFPNFITDTMQALPRGVNGSLLAVVLFLLLNSDKMVFKILSLLIGLAMILFHNVSLISVLIIYSFIFILQFLYSIQKDGRLVNLRFIIIITLSTIGYWVFYSSALLTNIMESLNFQAISYSPISSTLDLYEILNYIQFSPYIILTTIGILAILWFTLHEDRVKLLGIIGLGLLALSIPNPLFSIPNIFTKLIFNRFMEYTSVFIIIVVSFGLFYVFNKLSTKMKIIFMSLIFVTCLLSIENDFTATDNPLFKRPFYTFYFNTPEMGSIDTLLKISKNSYLMSDYVMTRYIWHYFDRGHLLEIDYSGSKFFKERDIDLIIIRESELQKRPLQLFVTPEFVNNPAWSEGDFIYFNYDAKVFENVNIYNRSYDNGYVITYN